MRRGVESAKESGANVAASAKAGMDKTKATMEEKVEKARGHDPLEKELATERKDEKIQEAELNKQQARAEHAAEKQAASATGGHVGGVPHGGGA